MSIADGGTELIVVTPEDMAAAKQALLQAHATCPRADCVLNARIGLAIAKARIEARETETCECGATVWKDQDACSSCG